MYQNRSRRAARRLSYGGPAVQIVHQRGFSFPWSHRNLLLLQYLQLSVQASAGARSGAFP
jgi:hypothetical protein